jgi:hypothetical protein
MSGDVMVRIVSVNQADMAASRRLTDHSPQILSPR